MQSRGKARSKLWRWKQHWNGGWKRPPFTDAFHTIPRCFIETVRETTVSGREFGAELCRRDQLPISPPLTVIIVLCTTFCIYILARYKTPDEITDMFENLESKGKQRGWWSSFLPLAEGIFFRGGGNTEAREDRVEVYRRSTDVNAKSARENWD